MSGGSHASGNSAGAFGADYADASSAINIITEGGRIGGVLAPCRAVMVGVAGTLAVEYLHPRGAANIAHTFAAEAGVVYAVQLARITGGTAEDITVWW